MNDVDILAKKIWDYLHTNHKIQKADCILVFGSEDILPAHRGCDLFFEGYAPIIIFSGNNKNEETITRPEAEIYRDIALKRGVPVKSIFVENKSFNTGQNTIFSKELIEKENLPHRKIIVVQKPYMERRTYATFKKFWAKPEIFVTSPQISYEEYIKNNPCDSKEVIINRIVGTLIRMREYPSLSFQIKQEIGDDVWVAGQELIRLGYDKYILKNNISLGEKILTNTR